MIKVNQIIFVPLAIFTFIISGCSDCPNKEDLVGKYYYSLNGHPSDQDTIFVFANGTYKSQYSPATGVFYERIGQWKFDTVDCRIEFEDFISGGQFLDTIRIKGGWNPKIQEVDGEIRLIYASDINHYFAKTELLKTK